MPLNPAFEPILAATRPVAELDWLALPPAQARAMLDQPMAPAAPIPVARAEDTAIAADGRTIPARLYIPDGAGDTPPLIVYFHGGGWVLGTIETHDATCRELATTSGAAVLSVGYRLAPEHPFPAALDDAWAALLAAHQSGNPFGTDPARLAVAGDSAGGNIAAALAIIARDRSGPAIRHQLLLYPVIDADFTTASYRENGSGYFLTTDMMRFFWNHYMGGRDPKAEPLAALLRQKTLAGLPPATVIVGEYDPMRDEIHAYAKRLAEAGVPVALHTAPGMIHGFLGMTGMVPDARPWAELAGKAVGDALRH